MGGRITTSERVLLGVSGVTLVLTLASWFTMRVGAYSLVSSLAVTCAAAAFLSYRLRRPAEQRANEREPWRWLALGAALCVGFGLLYAAYPTYFLLGGQDPGPYLAFAARIAHTGGLDLRVPEFQHWARAHEPGLYRPFAAVYGDMGAPAALGPPRPQFVHLFTAYLANLFAAGGVEGAVRANAWIAVLCLLIGFALLRRLDSLGAAFAFVVVLGINPAFVWAARITLTEVVALWLNLFGLLLLVFAWDEELPWVGALAGGVLGLGVLNRLDGGLGTFALVGFSLAATIDGPRRSRVAAHAALVHLAVSTFGYIDGRRLAPDYFGDLNALSGGDVNKLIGLTSGFDVLALLIALLPARLKSKLPLNETTLRLGAYAIVVALTVWVLYGVTLRRLGNDPETATTLLELTWYLSWAVWPLCFFGMARALRAASFQRAFPLILMTAATFVIFSARTDVVHEHIWASRRWVPQTIPLLLACAALGAWALIRRLRGAARFGLASVVAALCLGPVLLFEQPFLFRSMLQGLPQAYERVASYARQQRSHWPVLTDSIHLASILTYVYEVPTILLNERGTDEAARGAFIGELGVGFDPFSLHNAAAVQARIRGAYLERRADAPPSKLIGQPVALEIGFFGPQIFDVTIPAAHPILQTRATTPTPQGALIATGEADTVLWGPWVELDAGHYRIEWYGSVAPRGPKERGTLDVITDAGKTTLAQMDLKVTDSATERLLGGLNFELDRLVKNIEFRVRVQEHSGVVLTRLRLQSFEH
jgi:hypothetical protein